MTLSAAMPKLGIDVGDLVIVTGGSHHGNVGRVVVRKPITVELRDFFRHETVYGVDFENGPNGRGFLVYFKGNQLERTS